MWKNRREHNIAYIDGQNLHLGTKAAGWKIDYARFRIYLRDKYKIREAYYFLWFMDESASDLYTKIQEAWFVIMFREHTPNLTSKKKGNVDVDIVFEMMKCLIEKEKFDKIVLVSGDGDYIKPVKYLISKWKFKKIIFPNGKYSTLYKKIKYQYGLNLSIKDIRRKIEYKKSVSKNWKKKQQKKGRP